MLDARVDRRVKPGNDGVEDHVNNAIRSSSESAMSTASGLGGGAILAAGGGLRLSSGGAPGNRASGAGAI